MESKLIAKWENSGLGSGKLEFFTNRPNLVVGKLADRDAEAEYECPYCKFYEIKTIKMERDVTKSGKLGKKFNRPSFPCSKCNKIIEVPSLKKK